MAGHQDETGMGVYMSTPTVVEEPSQTIRDVAQQQPEQPEQPAVGAHRVGVAEGHGHGHG